MTKRKPSYSFRRGFNDNSCANVRFCEIGLDDLSPKDAVANLIAQAIDMKASYLYFLRDEDCTTISFRRLGIV